MCIIFRFGVPSVILINFKKFHLTNKFVWLKNLLLPFFGFCYLWMVSLVNMTCTTAEPIFAQKTQCSNEKKFGKARICIFMGVLAQPHDLEFFFFYFPIFYIFLLHDFFNAVSVYPKLCTVWWLFLVWKLIQTCTKWDLNYFWP